jgi:small subunit ribosomal protein S9
MIKEKPTTKIKKPVKKVVAKPVKRVAPPKPVAKPVEKGPVIKEEMAEVIFDAKSNRYWEGVGSRKTSVARVRLYTQGDKVFLINNKPLNIYFADKELQGIADSALQKMKCADKFKVSIVVNGGGLHSQAEAIRHGISRALTLFNADFRKRLKKAGYLMRDPRMRERKKFGLKRARRAPQWGKR